MDDNSELNEWLAESDRLGTEIEELANHAGQQVQRIAQGERDATQARKDYEKFLSHGKEVNMGAALTQIRQARSSQTDADNALQECNRELETLRARLAELRNSGRRLMSESEQRVQQAKEQFKKNQVCYNKSLSLADDLNSIGRLLEESRTRRQKAMQETE